jgi:hypothetical protein
MKLKSLIHSEKGKIIISILLGFGIATLFRKSCTDSKGNNTCANYQIKQPDESTFESDGKCYTIQQIPSKCSDKPYALIA